MTLSLCHPERSEGSREHKVGVTEILPPCGRLNDKEINKMVWFLILAAVLAAFVYRIIACIRKSKQSGEEWNLADKYAANDFGE